MRNQMHIIVKRYSHYSAVHGYYNIQQKYSFQFLKLDFFICCIHGVYSKEMSTRHSIFFFYLQFDDKLSTFITKNSTVFHLSECIEYALKYGKTDKFVIVEKYSKEDPEDFHFIFRHPGYGLELCTDPADI